MFEQVTNVATLPGIRTASMAMPDAHWGYGFAVGGVAAFDPDEGVVSAGGVGFDISCGVRCLRTRLTRADVEPRKKDLVDALFRAIPAGVGSRGRIRLSGEEMDRMLRGGARWAVEKGWGERGDLERIEEGGQMRDARPEAVSDRARARMRDEVGTLGSGNHYLEVQEVKEVHDAEAAEAFGLQEGDVVVSIHCGSRGFGHQIGTEALREMLDAGRRHGIDLPDRELACAPVRSKEGEHYLGAMRSAINVALANRQVLTHLAREAFGSVLPQSDLTLLYDVSHNTCKVETHEVDGKAREVYVHRKGATRAWGPGHPGLPGRLRAVGPAGAHRRHDGHVELGAGRHRDRHARELRLRVPRRRPQHEPAPGAQAVERQAGGRGARAPRHPHSQPLAARRGRGGAGGLQGRDRGRGSDGEGRPRPPRRQAPADRHDQGVGDGRGSASHSRGHPRRTRRGLAA